MERRNSRRSWDNTHNYPARDRLTTIKPGDVFWNEKRVGWTFSVEVDGINVRSRFLYPRERIAREALRLEVDSIRAMIATKPDSETSGITTETMEQDNAANTTTATATDDSRVDNY